MQGRKVTLFLVIIFVISVIPITEIGINSAETIETSVKWSGTKEIDNDIIIKSGAQLTIEDGTTVKINADISISVEGSLIIEGTGIDGVKFISNISQQSELGSKSTWEGIQIQNTGIDIGEAIFCAPPHPPYFFGEDWNQLPSVYFI